MPEGAEPAVVERSEPRERVEDALAHVTALLRRHRLVEGLVHDQLNGGADAEAAALRESAVTRQTKAELERTLARLHPADIAFVLEALPLDERLYIWELVKADRDGEILVEVSTTLDPSA